MSDNLDIIQSFWYGDKLSPLEQLCLRSFLSHGHPFHLYVYGDVEGVPEGTVLKDANEIFNEDKVFFYGPQAGVGTGSVAVFANYFRYKLLALKGNWWVDTDIVCLKPFRFPEELIAGYGGQGTLANGVIKSPKGSKLMTFLADYAERPFTTALPWENWKGRCLRFLMGLKRGFDPGAIPWGTTGPRGFTTAVEHLEVQGAWKPKITFHPIEWREAIQLFGSSEKWSLEQFKSSHGIHLCNEVLRRNKIDKFSPFPEDSVVGQLMKQYGIVVS